MNNLTRPKCSILNTTYLLAFITLFSGENVVSAATINVNGTTCTLKDAITAANLFIIQPNPRGKT